MEWPRLLGSPATWPLRAPGNAGPASMDCPLLPTTWSVSLEAMLIATSCPASGAASSR